MTGRARFITLEGGEGAGKSTQAKLLAAELEWRGITSVLTREPGGSPGAEAIRKLLVQGERDKWDGDAETLLVFAARADHVARKIKPALTDGKWVICDRFIDSTYAYQGIGRGVSAKFIDALSDIVLNGFVPDLTLILDIDPDAGLARTSSRADSGPREDARFERFGITFHRQLRKAFLDIAATHPERCVVIDAARPENDVAASIWQAVAGRLGL
ncbi:MAG: dTMP kinase [Rhizomicrobium sp.]|jgi:dTMP kinase